MRVSGPPAVIAFAGACSGTVIAAVCEKKQGRDGLSSFQTLVISTATRVGMGNLVGVVLLPLRRCCAVFWMWVTAILVRPPLYRIHPCPEIPPARPAVRRLARRTGLTICISGGTQARQKAQTLCRYGRCLRVPAYLFARHQFVYSNSVSSAFENAFYIPPLTTTLVLTAIAAVIVLRKNATVKSLDVMVPIMAVCYFITVYRAVQPAQAPLWCSGDIFAEAFGLRQAVAGVWCCADERRQARPVLQTGGQRAWHLGVLPPQRRRPWSRWALCRHLGVLIQRDTWVIRQPAPADAAGAAGDREDLRAWTFADRVPVPFLGGFGGRSLRHAGAVPVFPPFHALYLRLRQCGPSRAATTGGARPCIS